MNASSATPLPPASGDDLNRRLDFIIAADALRLVERRTYIGDGSRHENSAEHSWHLALAVLLFEPLARERDLNLQRMLELALLHDLPEIGAGDTYVYDNVGRESQAAREQHRRRRDFRPSCPPRVTRSFAPDGTSSSSCKAPKRSSCADWIGCCRFCSITPRADARGCITACARSRCAN